MDEYSVALLEAVEAAVPDWVGRCLASLAEDVRRDAVAQTEQYVGTELRKLFEQDIDEQHTTPLAVMREATRLLTDLLVAAGVTPATRDDFSKQRFPDDHYNLTPVNWADIDESLINPGIAWGAAKAMKHKERHK